MLFSSNLVWRSRNLLFGSPLACVLAPTALTGWPARVCALNFRSSSFGMAGSGHAQSPSPASTTRWRHDSFGRHFRFVRNPQRVANSYSCEFHASWVKQIASFGGVGFGPCRHACRFQALTARFLCFSHHLLAIFCLAVTPSETLSHPGCWHRRQGWIKEKRKGQIQRKSVSATTWSDPRMHVGRCAINWRSIGHRLLRLFVWKRSRSFLPRNRSQYDSWIRSLLSISALFLPWAVNSGSLGRKGWWFPRVLGQSGGQLPRTGFLFKA